MNSSIFTHELMESCDFVKYMLTVICSDFIFGQYATAWFDGCDIAVLATDEGTITADGRVGSDGTSYYVITNSAIAAASGSDVTEGSFYLGLSRPLLSR
jgi:Pectinesterase